MTFPSTLINTTNLDSDTKSPADARADLYDLTVKLNTIIGEANGPQGVLVLDGSGKISTSRLPSNQAYTGILTLQPSDEIVSIRSVIRLNPVFTEDLLEDFDPSTGDLAMTIDGDAGNPALACYDGTAWRILRLRGTVGTVGSDLTSTFTISATADV
jgi:hypothetical protein